MFGTMRDETRARFFPPLSERQQAFGYRGAERWDSDEFRAAEAALPYRRADLRRRAIGLATGPSAIAGRVETLDADDAMIVLDSIVDLVQDDDGLWDEVDFDTIIDYRNDEADWTTPDVLPNIAPFVQTAEALVRAVFADEHSPSWQRADAIDRLVELYYGCRERAHDAVAANW